MQRVAKEINFSETAFLNIDNSKFLIKWFSPRTEVDICGHATIAAFELLTVKNISCLNEWVEIKSKKYSFKLRKDSKSNTISLLLPVFDLKECSVNELSSVIDIALIKRISCSDLDYIIEVDSLNRLNEIKIDFNKLAKINKRGLIVCFLGKQQDHIYFRYFCPALGFKEDPGTGSALPSLYTFLQKRVDFATKISFFQQSDRKSEGFVRKLENEDIILLETEVSNNYHKTLEID